MSSSRQYQNEQIESVIEHLSTKRKIVMQLPTGGGKTWEFALITKRYVENAGKSVLILVHRIELLHQAEKAIQNITGIKPYLVTSETKHFNIARVYIGMVESMINRLHLVQNIGLVILDEAHVDNFKKIHSVFLDELIIGVTATPISASRKDPMNRYYQSIVTGPQISELIKMGFLAQNITRCPKEIVDATQFAIDAKSGDYNERQMATEYKLPKHIINVCRKYREYCLREKTIIFNVNIEHSIQVTEAMVQCGFNARHLDAGSSSRPSERPGFKNERDEIIDWFRNTKDAVLCNVMIATMGFDEPTVRHIILNFATLSLPKYIQACGRGSRVIDEAWISKHSGEYPYLESPKSHFNIIDMGANYLRFGDWSDDRDWQYIFYHPQMAGDGIAPTKTCPNCEGLVHAAVRVCPLIMSNKEYCLHEFARRPESAEQDLEEMILVTKGINVEEVINKSKKKYEYYPMVSLAEDVVKAMFKAYGKDINDNVKFKYFKSYYALCIEWYAQTRGKIDGNIEDISDSSWHIKKALNNFNQLIKIYGNIYEMEVSSFDPEADGNPNCISFSTRLSLCQ